MNKILNNTKSRLAKELSLREVITACRNAVGKAHNADVQPLMSVVNEKKKELEYLQSNKEWLFNFEGGGWNSVSAKDMTEAKAAVRKKCARLKKQFLDETTRFTPVYNTIRLSTPEDKKNLLSMFN